MFKSKIIMEHHKETVDNVVQRDDYRFKLYSPNGKDYRYSFVISKQDIETIKDLISVIN